MKALLGRVAPSLRQEGMFRLGRIEDFLINIVEGLLPPLFGDNSCGGQWEQGSRVVGQQVTDTVGGVPFRSRRTSCRDLRFHARGLLDSHRQQCNSGPASLSGPPSFSFFAKGEPLRSRPLESCDVVFNGHVVRSAGSRRMAAQSRPFQYPGFRLVCATAKI